MSGGRSRDLEQRHRLWRKTQDAAIDRETEREITDVTSECRPHETACFREGTMKRGDYYTDLRCTFLRNEVRESGLTLYYFIEFARARAPEFNRVSYSRRKADGLLYVLQLFPNVMSIPRPSFHT